MGHLVMSEILEQVWNCIWLEFVGLHVSRIFFVPKL